MRVPREIVDEIVAHAREDAPNECCGLIGGSAEEARTLYRATNAAATWLRYEVDPGDLLKITRQIEESGEELAAIYHSHTRSEAYPSQTDVNLAEGWPDPLYIIVSIATDDPQVRGFRIRDGTVEEVGLEVV